MVAHKDGRIELTVLGGFLGSGKTTWLRHQLHHGRMPNALVIVNEAADVPVDDALLSGFSRIELLAGRCACCDGRQDLVNLLRKFCDERVSGSGRSESVERIVLETSGLADPGAIVEAIRADPVLIHHVKVGEILVAVDAVHIMDQIRREPLSRQQIETADQLIVTKVDVAEEERLKYALATLHALNPGAEISGADMGRPAMLPDFAGIEAAALPESTGEKTGAIMATKLVVDDSIDWATFSVWLSALLHARGDDIMRVKGIKRTPAGRLLLQSVRRVVQQPEIVPPGEPEDEKDDNSIVFIGRGFTREDLTRSLQRFAHRADAE